MLKKRNTVKDANDPGQMFKAQGWQVASAHHYLYPHLTEKEFSSKESLWDGVAMVTGQDL